LISASTKTWQIVLDSFPGSGTTSVVAKKLNREYVSIEVKKYYACLAEYGWNLQIKMTVYKVTNLEHSGSGT